MLQLRQSLKDSGGAFAARRQGAESIHVRVTIIRNVESPLSSTQSMNIDCVFSGSPSTKLNIATFLVGCLAFAAPVSAQQVANIEIVADQPGLGLHQITAQASSVSTFVAAGRFGSAFSNSWAFSPVCVAPCHPTLSAGPQRLAVSNDMHTPVPLSHLVNIEDGAQYRLEFEDRGWIRALGWTVFSLSMGLMVVGPIMYLDGDQYYSPSRELREAGLTLSIASVALLFGAMALVFANDHRDLVRIDSNGAIRF